MSSLLSYSSSKIFNFTKKKKKKIFNKFLKLKILLKKLILKKKKKLLQVKFIIYNIIKLNKKLVFNSLKKNLLIILKKRFLLKKKKILLSQLIFLNKKIIMLKNLKLKFFICLNLKKKKKTPPLNFILTIKFKINNIFIYLSHFKKKIFIKKKKKKKNIILLKKTKRKISVFKFWSAGLLKLQCSKKKLKYIFTTMLKNIKKYLKLKFYAIKILSSKYYIKYIYKQLKKFSIISKFLIINSFKIFNGCRLRKVRRKKRLKFRIFR